MIDFMIVLLAILVGADLMSTMIGLKIGLQESNPIAREIGLAGLFLINWLLVWVLWVSFVPRWWAYTLVVVLIAIRSYVVRHNWKRIIRR